MFVHAKDIIETINAYQIDNPSGGAISIPFATTEDPGGILSDTHNLSVYDANKLAEVKFYPTGHSK